MKLPTLLLTFSFFLISILAFAQAADKAIILKTPTGEIHGTLLAPKSNKKIPVILFIAGSGPTDRNGNSPMAKNNSLKFLAQALAEKGIATLRYDKRGIAESKDALDSVQNLRFEDWVNDTKLWVNWLESKNEFSNIIILGHSQGALVGLLAAQDNKAQKYISLAGAGQSIDKTIYDQINKQSPPLGATVKPLLDSLSKGFMVHSAPPMLASIFDKSIQPFLMSWMKYNPATEIVKLKIPILILQGNTDIQVMLEDANLLHQANERNQLVIIDQMNHVLKKVSEDLAANYATYNNAELAIHSELISAIVAFVFE